MAAKNDGKKKQTEEMKRRSKTKEKAEEEERRERVQKKATEWLKILNDDPKRIGANQVLSVVR